MRLRSVFLAPTALVMILLFFVPLLITLAYSLLTRGPYGGVFLPWTFENYQRALDPLYLAICGVPFGSRPFPLCSVCFWAFPSPSI